MIETVITMKIKTTKEQFESKDFQELLNDVKTGKLSREMKDAKHGKMVEDVAVSYWTNYKSLKP